MARFNPALSESVFRSAARSANSAERMTVSGTVAKSFLLVALTIFSASWIWSVIPTRPDLVAAGLVFGSLGGLVVAMITIFGPQRAPWSAPIYAVLEGLALGAIAGSLRLTPQLAALPFQAVGLTFTVALGMLVAYSTGLLRATEMFRRVIVTATFGVVLFYLFTIVLQFFHVAMPFLHDSSPLGIGISLVITAIAAFNLILNFDLIERGARYGAPKFMEWYGGFALLVTLVWLYMEILDLLARMQNRR